jgi:Cu/Ag efflux pump CusA
VLSRPGNKVAVRLYGQNYNVLAQKATEVERLMSGVDGVKNPTTDPLTTQPTFQVKVKLDQALRQGLKPGDVRRAASTLLQGLVVGDFFEKQKVFEVVVLGKPTKRPSVQEFRSLPIDTPSGGQVPLGSIADVTIAQAPVDIRHDSTARYIDVTAGVNGRDTASVRDDIQSKLKDVSFPLEYHAEVVGGSNAHTTHSRFASFVVAVALGILLLLQAAFRNWRLAILLLTLLPLAVAGGVVVALIAGSQHSIGAYAGLLAVFCIAARHGILLLKRIETIADENGAHGSAAAAQLGARQRALPTIASSAATFAGLIPFIVLGDAPGNEILHEMAAVIAGGLVTSAVLVLFLLPAAYAHLQLGRKRAPVAARASAAPVTAIALVGLLMFLSGCGDSASSEASGPPSSKLVHKGDKTTVVLSPTAAKRLGVQTAAVTKKKHHVAVPYDAVLYEPNGKAITYTSPAPLQYERASVVVARFKGNTAVLKKGPPSGTKVVTVGGDEILGVEEGVEGE